MTLLLADLNLVQIALPMVGAILLSYGIFQVIVESRNGERKKVLDRLRGESSRVKEAAAASILKRNTLTEDAGNIINKTFGKLAFIPRLQNMLDQASLDWSATKMVANLFSAGLILTAGMVLMDFSVLASCGIGITVFFAPIGYVSMRRKRRMKRLVNQLPDVFEMMSQALRAGHSLASAIQLVHEQLPDPISMEFGRVFHEQNLGIKIEDALLAMAELSAPRTASASGSSIWPPAQACCGIRSGSARAGADKRHFLLETPGAAAPAGSAPSRR